jgi:hypothetical protein
MKTLLFSLILILIASCGSGGSGAGGNGGNAIIDSAMLDSVEIRTSASELAWSSEVTKTLFNNLGDTSLQSLFTTTVNEDDAKLVGCSNFNILSQDQKKIFYIVFLAAIAERESDFDPKNETYDPAHGNVNIGLLQIDTESAKRHASEIVDDINDEDLKDSSINLNIGTFILRNQIQGKFRSDVKSRLFPLRSYYWEVLNLKKRSRVIASFKNNKANLPFCLE